ncbi:peptide-methionine (S)-S-oxide reductase MsrA [Corynebacterium choanae]|uniref:Peptide methionine sulfoxide reductase MsrA n=1 Tax=Corynebacterium choanae TaxID=1862358 RepID=A0A3G6J3C5_9CORY|nr:peptide-methionine (S)-S-oxide reductase MsrA [Corynebacterium choanae]AZA12517.1 Peptide methionine sulfoxide reductase MsrA [Corynebacterium choanae]
MGWLFERNTQPVTAETALHGGTHPVLTDPQPHAVLGTPITGPWAATQRSVLIGMGCYWGAEKLFWNQPGVLSTSVGFAGGFTPHPTYREVCTGRTGHAEVVEVVYDPAQTTLAQLLAVALEQHDPTQLNRQGNDVGTQYRSAIYTTGEDAAEDLQVAQQLVKTFGERLQAAGFGLITTEVRQLAETPAGEYYRAEDEHQQYLAKNPEGYCPVHATGVRCSTDPTVN